MLGAVALVDAIDVTGQAGLVQHATAALIELPLTVPATELPVAPCRRLRPLYHGYRLTPCAVHPDSLLAAMIGDATSARQQPPDLSLPRELTEPMISLPGMMRTTGSDNSPSTTCESVRQAPFLTRISSGLGSRSGGSVQIRPQPVEHHRQHNAGLHWVTLT